MSRLFENSYIHIGRCWERPLKEFSRKRPKAKGRINHLGVRKFFSCCYLRVLTQGSGGHAAQCPHLAPALWSQLVALGKGHRGCYGAGLATSFLFAICFANFAWLAVVEGLLEDMASITRTRNDSVQPVALRKRTLGVRISAATTGNRRVIFWMMLFFTGRLPISQSPNCLSVSYLWPCEVPQWSGCICSHRSRPRDNLPEFRVVSLPVH